MKLIATGFKANNGTLTGTLIAVEENDNDAPLGWESAGNWSSPRFQRESVSQLVLATGISEERARALIFGALRDGRRQAGIPAPGDNILQPEHELPRIVVSNRQPRDIETDAWNVLSSVNETSPEFFSLGSTIVHLKKGREGVSLYPMTLAGLRGHLKTLADFIRLIPGSVGLEEKPSEVPRTMVEDMLASERPPLPTIVSIVQTPVLVQPGKVVGTVGYHADSGLYLVLGQSLDVPDRPSSEDMSKAMHLILGELLVDFPFTTEAERAHAVCALLTPLVRPYIKGAAPLFLVEGPTEGTGKGLFCDVIAQVATGGNVTVMTEGKDEDEWRKRITAKLKTAPALVCIDNVIRRLESAALSSALTMPVWEDREMRTLQLVRIPVRCTWLANGNNPTLSREIARRTVRIRIDAGVEKPSERSGFHNDLEGRRGSPWALSHRSEIQKALLTLVKAWLAAGKPGTQVRMGSFQEWADCLGGILSVAGLEGFLANREEIYTLASQEDQSWMAFIEAWWEELGEQRVGVDQLLELAIEQKLLAELRGGRTRLGAGQSMGKALMARRDRRHGNWFIRLAGSAHGVQYYRLERVDIQSLPAQPVKTPQTPEKTNQTNQTNLVPEAKGGGLGGFSGFLSDIDPISEAAADTTSYVQRSAQKLDFLPPEFPTFPCQCGNGGYWLTRWKQWLCYQCHPDPTVLDDEILSFFEVIADADISIEDKLRIPWPDRDLPGTWLYVSPTGKRTMVMAVEDTLEPGNSSIHR